MSQVHVSKGIPLPEATESRWRAVLRDRDLWWPLVALVILAGEHFLVPNKQSVFQGKAAFIVLLQGIAVLYALSLAAAWRKASWQETVRRKTPLAAAFLGGAGALGCGDAETSVTAAAIFSFAEGSVGRIGQRVGNTAG